MDTIIINCPYCGGNMERRRNEYFAYCPYCGREVCFDEIKEEAMLGSYRDAISQLQTYNNALAYNQQQQELARQKLRTWVRRRNILFTVMSLLHCIGFMLVCTAPDADSDRTGFGMLMMFAAWLTLIMTTALFALSYPQYDPLTGRSDPISRLGLLFKLFIVGIAMCALGMLVGVIILAVMGKLS